MLKQQIKSVTKYMFIFGVLAGLAIAIKSSYAELKNMDDPCVKHAYISPHQILTVGGGMKVTEDSIWLTHEHILVDFIGADKISAADWNHDVVVKTMKPQLEAVKQFDVQFFVDATPKYLGRDVNLLAKVSTAQDIAILTNTGLYGARGKIFIPQYVKSMSDTDLAAKWISEYEQGIDGTSIRPGFIKIGVDATIPLHPIDSKLVHAAAKTHLKTGLTILSHTGPALGLWPQIEILKKEGVSPAAFVWVHAQFEKNNTEYIQAAKEGMWIGLDGVAWDVDLHVNKLVFAKQNNILDRILLSHDAGWYDPQRPEQSIKPFTHIFTKLIPQLMKRGFTMEDIDQLLTVNPARAFGIGVKKCW
ncbi:hypothetical protein [Agaribacter marinus]|nr:hypothetical protein [Agaribacter marinus]